MENKLENIVKIAEEKALKEFLREIQKQLEDYDDSKDYDYICGARDIINLLIDKINK